MQEYPLRSPIGDAPVYYLPETETTMSVARRLAAEGKPSGFVVLTDFQSAGRGRLPGRAWVSAQGDSLMFTVAMKETDPALAPLRAGWAVSRSLESLFGLAPLLKWPNDVLIGSRKVSGILCEYAEPWLFTGAGINLHQESFPTDLLFEATSVRMESRGTRVDRDELLITILENLNSPPVDLVGQINSILWHRGTMAELRQADGSLLKGTVMRVDPDGGLVLESNGAQMHLLAGEFASSANPSGPGGNQ